MPSSGTVRLLRPAPISTTSVGAGAFLVQTANGIETVPAGDVLSWRRLMYGMANDGDVTIVSDTFVDVRNYRNLTIAPGAKLRTNSAILVQGTLTLGDGAVIQGSPSFDRLDASTTQNGGEGSGSSLSFTQSTGAGGAGTATNGAAGGNIVNGSGLGGAGGAGGAGSGGTGGSGGTVAAANTSRRQAPVAWILGRAMRNATTPSTPYSDLMNGGAGGGGGGGNGTAVGGGGGAGGPVIVVMAARIVVPGSARITARGGNGAAAVNLNAGGGGGGGGGLVILHCAGDLPRNLTVDAPGGLGGAGNGTGASGTNGSNGAVWII